MSRLAVLTVALAVGVHGSGFTVQGSGFTVQSSVRLHHVHYNVGDPSAAMADVIAKAGGTRQIVPGLGVGVKIGDVFVLFDRADADSSARTAAESFSAAADWLKAKGLSVVASDVSRLSLAAGPHHMAFATSNFDAVVDRLGTPVTRRGESALFDAGGVLLEIVRETELPDAFWCPMHPDVRSGTTGKCPLCAMDLVPIPPPKIGEYNLDVALQRTARGASGLTLTVREPDTNALVRDFAIVHGKIFHLFIVSRDLEYFAHVHPEQGTSGALTLRHPLPPGEYMLIADFLPQGGTPQMVQKAIVLTGQPRPAAIQEPPDLRVELKAEDVMPGKEACLTFTVTDAKTGEPVTDLEPLLGAPAHMLLVRADLSDAVHAHPEELVTGGPRVSFHPLIPADGDYKLWVQFQRRGRVTTVPFRLRAER